MDQEKGIEYLDKMCERACARCNKGGCGKYGFSDETHYCYFKAVINFVEYYGGDKDE